MINKKLLRVVFAAVAATFVVSSVPTLMANAEDIGEEISIESETEESLDDAEAVVDDVNVVTADADYTIGDYIYTMDSSYKVSIKQYLGSSADVTVPSKVTIDGTEYVINTIDYSAFAGNLTLTSVEIPKEINRIGNNAFKGCLNLSKVTINGDLLDCDNWSTWQNDCVSRSVFYEAGKNVESLEVVFSEGVTVVPANLFATGKEKTDNVYAKVTKVTLPDSLKEIKTCAFYNCYDLGTIVWGTENGKNIELTKIGSLAFLSCNKLTEVNIPESVETVESEAFENCLSLKKVTTEGKDKTIGARAFSGCLALESVTIGTGGVLEDGAFKSCTKLSSITINGDLLDCHNWSTWQNDCVSRSVFFEAGKNVESLEVVFGKGVTRIPANLFATGKEKTENVYCHVTKVTIPSTLELIGKYCFYDCYDLKTIHFMGTEARWNKLVNEIQGEEDKLFSYLDANNIIYEFGNELYGKESPVIVCVKGQINVKFAEAAKTKVDGKKYKIVVSDKKVATMSKKGVVKCKSEGTTDITVTKAGDVTLTYHIRVVDPGKYKKTYKIVAGQNETLDFNIDKSLFRVDYISSKENIATVDKNTGVVTAVAKGTSRIMINVYTTDIEGKEVLAKAYKVTVKVKKA